MNREILKPHSIGAIIICALLVFKVNISLLLLLFLISTIFTVHLKVKNKTTLYIFIIVLALFLGSVSVKRNSLELKGFYTPLEICKTTKSSIFVLKDSTPVNGGFFTTGIIQKFETKQFKIQANCKICIFSNKELFLGQIINCATINIENGEYSTNYKKSEMIFKNIFYQSRYKIFLIIKNKLNSPLLMALITGNKGGLSLDYIDLFRVNGCSHILALSGFHISIITLLVVLFLRIFFNGNSLLVIALFFISLYLVFVGITPSLFRSVLMFFIGVFLKIIKKKFSIFNILLISFYISIIISPSQFYTISFQLSFFALWGILILGGELSNLPFLSSLPNFIKTPVSASLSALLTTLFIVFPIFKVLYPLGVIVSVIVTPIITLYIWIGILSFLVPQLYFVLNILEKFVIFLLTIGTKLPFIEQSVTNSFVITSIPIIISVILVILKIYRRADARRFNIKFKL